MMPHPTVTPEQREALEETNGMPVQVIDRVRMQKYVLMDAMLYQTITQSLREHDPYTAELFDRYI